MFTSSRRQGRQRAKFFDDARGSAIECAACMDASVAKGFALLERIQPGKEMLVRVVAMLTKLVERFDPYQNRVRASAQGLTDPLEDEDDDEHEAAVATLWRALAGVGRDVGLRRAQSSRLAKSGRLIR